MVTNQQTEQTKPEIFICIECDAERDADNLFVLEMRELAEIKGAEEGKEVALILPEDLPEFAICADCQSPEETYHTLASSIANCNRYHKRRNRFQSQKTVTETEELVSCFRCEELGKNMLIPRREAMAPGWVGCNILKGRRLRLANPNKNPLPYVTSADLLKPGKYGFVACPKCMEIIIPDFQEQARELGLSEDVIAERIRPRLLIAMVKSVRKKENRESQNP